MAVAMTKKKFDNLTSSSIQVRTPDGTMYVIVNCDNRGPINIYITIGKSGSEIAAWCSAISNLMSNILERGGTLQDLIELLSNITADRKAYMSKRAIRSSIDGIVYGLNVYMKYRDIPSNRIPSVSNVPWSI